eukprot:Opistho-2@85047
MSFAKFMNQKDFHPSNMRNQRRIWIAEQKALASDKKTKDLQKEYKDEQEWYAHKEALGVSRADSDLERKKFSINFMYQLPPGLAKTAVKSTRDIHREILEAAAAGASSASHRDGDATTSKDAPAAGLRGAPREGEYTKDIAVRDKPFGIEVRNVHCMRCGAQGHSNTDRVCPLFSVLPPEAKRLDYEDPMAVFSADPIKKGKAGLVLKSTVLVGRRIDASDPNQQFVMDEEPTAGSRGKRSSGMSERDEDDNMRFLKSLSESEKAALLRKLEEMGADSDTASDSSRLVRHGKRKRGGRESPTSRSPSPRRDKRRRKERKEKKEKKRERKKDKKEKEEEKEKDDKAKLDKGLSTDDWRLPSDRRRAPTRELLDEAMIGAHNQYDEIRDNTGAEWRRRSGVDAESRTGGGGREERDRRSFRESRDTGDPRDPKGTRDSRDLRDAGGRLPSAEVQRERLREAERQMVLERERQLRMAPVASSVASFDVRSATGRPR